MRFYGVAGSLSTRRRANLSATYNAASRYPSTEAGILTNMSSHHYVQVSTRTYIRVSNALSAGLCSQEQQEKETKNKKSKVIVMDMNQNPLSMDLSSVDTSLPLLAADLYDLRVAKVELVRTKDGLAGMIKIELKNTAPGKTVKGDDCGAGSVTIFDQIMYEPKGKATLEMVVRNVAGFVQGVGITGARLDNVAQWHKQAEGQVVRAKVEYTPAGSNPTTGKSYPPKNEIGYYVKR